jgi:hypothetical protein
MKNKTLKYAIVLLCLCCTTRVFSQVETINKDASVLEITSSALYTDNINPTLAAKSAAIGVSFAPQGQLIATPEYVWFVLDYRAELQQYRLNDDFLLSQNQHFNSYQGSLLTRVFLADAWHLDAKLVHSNQTQQYGSGISRLKSNIVDADQLQTNTASVSLVYGSDTSTRFVSVTTGIKQDVYQENNSYSALFNAKQQFVEAKLSYRYSAASKIVMQVTAKNDDYEVVSRDDSELIEGVIGFEWNPSGKSRLQLMVGQYLRAFDTAKKSSGVSWYGIFDYEPREDLLISLGTSRTSGTSISETTTDTVTQTVRGKVTYVYSEQWQLAVGASSENTQFNDNKGGFELDEQQGQAELILKMNDHSKASLAFSLQDVATNDAAFDFRQNKVGMTWHYRF